MYQIATPEKALCDKLYTLSPIKNMKELENILFNDLRIDLDEFNKLNIEDIEQIEEEQKKLKYQITKVKED